MNDKCRNSEHEHTDCQAAGPFCTPSAGIPTGTYTVTLTTSEIVAVEMAMEARHDTLRKLRAELAAGEHDTASIDETIERAARLIAKLKRQTADSPALSAMLTASRGR